MNPCYELAVDGTIHCAFRVNASVGSDHSRVAKVCAGLRVSVGNMPHRNNGLAAVLKSHRKYGVEVPAAVRSLGIEVIQTSFESCSSSNPAQESAIVRCSKSSNFREGFWSRWQIEGIPNRTKESSHTVTHT